MDHLNKLVAGMSKEQIRFYKLFASRTTHQHERRDLQLFDAIRQKGESLNEDAMALSFYGKDGKNAWYRLRNRLLSDLNKSLTILYYDESDFMSACHMLALYHHFVTQNKQEEARHYLRKAEKYALALEHHELLDIVYGEFIRLSHESLHIDPEHYVNLRRENRKEQEALRIIDDLLAVVNYRLKTSQNFSPDKNPLIDLLKNTLDDFVKDRDLRNSPRLRFRMYLAVTQVLLQRHDYKALEVYLLRTYKEFSRDQLFTRDNHDTKLQMLTYIVNTLFKNKKLRQSLQWTEKLRVGTEEFHRLLYDKYFFYYYNSLVINYSILDRDKALEILGEMQENERIKANSFYHFFVYLNLAVLNFDKQAYKESLRHFNRLFLLDGFKNADPSLRLHISICELIPRFELQQFDVIEYKSARLRKDFREMLASEYHYGEQAFLRLLKQLPDHLPLRRHPEMKKKCQELIGWMRKNKDADAYIIDYTVWLEKLL